jgi:tetratricopeptide repeat protein 30
MFPEATRNAVRVDNEQYSQRVLMLQAVIKYEQDELSSCKSLLDQCHAEDPDVLINYAGISFKEGKFEEARNQYVEAINTMGYQADLALNIALCYYREVKEMFYGTFCILKINNTTIAETIRTGPSSHCRDH